jgi:hypothetical protein
MNYRKTYTSIWMRGIVDQRVSIKDVFKMDESMTRMRWLDIPNAYSHMLYQKFLNYLSNHQELKRVIPDRSDAYNSIILMNSPLHVSLGSIFSRVLAFNFYSASPW